MSEQTPPDVPHWICRRCSSENSPRATVCASCGLLRGADVPAAEMVPAATTHRARAFRLSVTQWTFVAIIAGIALAGTWYLSAHRDPGGEISDPGNLSPFELQVGDCFDLIDVNAEQTDTVRGVPCDEPHVYEVFWTGNYPGETYPSPEEVIGFIDSECVPAFAEYVGISFDQSSYGYHFGGPTQASFANGERRFACYLHHQTEAPISGSAQGSGR